jgi:uncharacterized membrane protein
MSDKPFPWRTLLFISVALNLLAVGAIAGAYGAGVRLEREAPQAAIARMPGARAFLAALPPETRAKMRTELADSWQESRQARQAARDARRAAFEAAAAEPYDVERVRAAFVQLRAADQAAIAVFHDNVVEAFGRLSTEERREALEALRLSAPANRRSVAPDASDDEAAAPADDPAWQERREEFREKMRERRRERQERRQAQ